MNALSATLRGGVLLPGVHGQVRYLPHAQVHLGGGRVVDVEPLPGESDTGLLLLPGMVDLHCHWPQGAVRGLFSGQLLPWLRESIWPAEAAFADVALAHAQIHRFVTELTGAGTCAGLFFGSPFAANTRAFLSDTPPGFLEGAAIMTHNGPEALLHSAQATLAILAETVADFGRRVSVAPRFAANLDDAGLAACGTFAAQHGLAVQSHLSENPDELAWVRALYPHRRDYTDVYAQAGLLGPRTVMAHGIHLSDRELGALAETQTLIAHCPTSNEALGSGRMPLERLREAGVPWVLATDVGAGPQLSGLHVMARFLAVHAGVAEVTASEALCRMTAVPGAWLTQFDAGLAGLGTLTPGAPAHVVALPHPGGDQAEDVLRRLLQAPTATLETLPLHVWLWGRPVSWVPGPG